MDDLEALNRTLAGLRQDQPLPPLRRAGLDPDPLREFARWLQGALAAEVPLPHAMALATATRQGAPAVRMVLLKGFDAEGFRFYTDARSRKAEELAENPRAALVFHWPQLHRQVRLEGTIAPLPRAQAEAYFRSRPAASRLAAILSPQSRVVPDRAFLEARLEALRRRYRDRPQAIPVPEHWIGYRLQPRVYEFWQHHPDRLHDRFRYTRRARGGWTIERLAP